MALNYFLVLLLLFARFKFNALYTDKNHLLQNSKHLLLYKNYADISLYITKPFSNSSDLDSKYNYLHHNRKRRNIARQSLCDNLCICQRELHDKFKEIYCDLDGKEFNHILGKNYGIPHSTVSIVIKLAAITYLRIEEGFFTNNRVNRLLIMGSLNGKEQVEIGTNAFKGNEKAPFPEIEITNCYTVVLRTKAFKDEFKLSILNCNDVIIYPNTFFNTSFEAKFHFIKNLRMQEQSFNSSKATLNIASSNIDSLYRFDASLREILFFNCSIGTIESGTFDVLTINSIIFEQCKIDIFKKKAITEKLLSPHLVITKAIIGVIESEAISGSGITELILSKNEIDTIQDNAIYVTTINAAITQNRIKHLGNKWFRVKEWSNITVSRNQFGDYGLLVLDKTIQPITCLFEGNFITNPKLGSLNISNPYCVMREISFYKSCSCNTTWLQELSSRDLKSESYCTIDENLKFCFNATIFNVLKYKKEVCDYEKKQLLCIKNINLKKIQGEFFKPEELERKSKHIKLIFILSGLGIILAFVLAALLFYIILLKPKAINTRVSESPSSRTNSALLKDIKIFSDEDRLIIRQTLDMIKEKYPKNTFEQIFNATQVLLEGDITEMLRVKSIGDIVQILAECQNPGDDFVAFTDILYRYLAPTAYNTSEPVYAEPNLIDRGKPKEETSTGSMVVDHVYNEPISAQQPLLISEYFSPVDKEIESIYLYSEPVLNCKETDSTVGKIILKDKSSRFLSYDSELISNLPDVLKESKSCNNESLSSESGKTLNLNNQELFENLETSNYAIPNKPNSSIDYSDSRILSKELSISTKSNYSAENVETMKIDDIIKYAQE